MGVVELLGDPALGTIVGVVGLIAAATFYVRGKKEKRLVFANKENVVIGEARDLLSERLKISFDEVDVERVTRSVFVIWNAGRSTIRRSDIAEGDPLRIEFPAGTRILTTSIDRATREAIRASLRTGDSDPTVFLSFDFLDFRDGANLSIAHTATAGAWALKGTVLGMPVGVQDWGPAPDDVERFRTPKPKKAWYVRLSWVILKMVVRWLLYVAPLAVVLAAIFTDAAVRLVPSLGRPDTTDVLVPGQINWYWVAGGVFLFLIECLVIAWVLRTPPKKLTSEGSAEVKAKKMS